jgi:S-DNA-T family DNA segregation ATPase FtsK/SpoIIIE
LLTGVLGWTWMRSRPAGSPGAKLTGIILTFLFAPALFGLIPTHPHILYGLPVAGLTGRLVADLLVRWFNVTGAWIVAITLVAAAVYLSTTFSFNTAREWIGIKLAFLLAWRDRFFNWRRDRAKRRELKAAARLDKIHEKDLAKGRKAAEKAAKKEKGAEIPVATARSREDERDEMPHRHAGFAETVIPEVPGASKASALWNSMPRTTAPEPSATSHPTETLAESRPAPAAASPARPQPMKKTEEPGPAIGERADTELRTVTVAPKNVSGYRLPASTLLHRSDDPSPVREDDLRRSAQILVEKCAEFDVLGQVVQINPGPVVTTFEFRPEAGIKYSRVTGLAEDLCLAMKAESILIERMPGKSTVGIQVPNDERETIWLRDVIES